MSAYGPVQEYLSLDHVEQFNPDLVLMLFCLATDFADNVAPLSHRVFSPVCRPGK